MPAKTNRLIHQSSPYLRQHAHNPVDWYPWGEEALERAKNEDKPILVSIGYSACHWCHVMERESFEDEATAAIMNEHFINIKIDREERPDLDQIYMDAVQAMTGSGGWPLNVFLTPDKKPFYGGTYFPPVRTYQRSSWKEVLTAVSSAFHEKRNEISEQAESLLMHIERSNSFGIGDQELNIPYHEQYTLKQLELIFDNIMKTADKEWGGFGRAPKFPQTFCIQFLLRYHHYTGNQLALNQALLSLDKMIHGGIYDQLGGGFARYSTDTEWLAPHFEKMLYDNALLVAVLSEAYQLTGKDRYAKVIRQTIDFIERELMDASGGFYSALDADSEGEEGKFYVWQKKEIEEELKDDAEIFCAYYDISDRGNWEHRNILRILTPLEAFALKLGMEPAELERRLDKSRRRLLEARRSRVRPMLDNKILLGWNALMNTACSKAYAALGEEHYKDLALRNMDFLLSDFRGSGEHSFLHISRDRPLGIPAFLDDYAYLIQALIHLQETTGKQEFLFRAKELAQYVISWFSDPGSPQFFYTPSNQKDVIVRKKEIYDGATPSGNSIMAWNLRYLSFIFGKKEWKELATEMTGSMSQVVINYPTSFGFWATQHLEHVFGTLELAIVGDQYQHLLVETLHHFIPQKVLQSNPLDNENFPLLTGRFREGKTYIYLCRDYSCRKPLDNVPELLQLIEKELGR